MSKNIRLKDLKFKKIKLDDAKKDIIPNYQFPKYTTFFINQANYWKNGTVPEVVGQMTELVPQNKEKNQKEWEEWYLERYPDAIDNATDIIYELIINFKESINTIDRDMVKDWVKDLVLVKSRQGLIYQEMILNYIAENNNTTYRLANPEEESKGIDGYVGNKPFQIKPHTYLTKPQLQETIPCDIIYYKDTGTYLYIYFEG